MGESGSFRHGDHGERSARLQQERSAAFVACLAALMEPRSVNFLSYVRSQAQEDSLLLFSDIVPVAACKEVASLSTRLTAVAATATVAAQAFYHVLVLASRTSSLKIVGQEEPWGEASRMAAVG